METKSTMQYCIVVLISIGAESLANRTIGKFPQNIGEEIPRYEYETVQRRQHSCDRSLRQCNLKFRLISLSYI